MSVLMMKFYWKVAAYGKDNRTSARQGQSCRRGGVVFSYLFIGSWNCSRNAITLRNRPFLQGILQTTNVSSFRNTWSNSLLWSLDQYTLPNTNQDTATVKRRSIRQVSCLASCVRAFNTWDLWFVLLNETVRNKSSVFPLHLKFKQRVTLVLIWFCFWVCMYILVIGTHFFYTRRIKIY